MRNCKVVGICLFIKVYTNTAFYSIPHNKGGYHAFGIAGCFLKKVLQRGNTEYVGGLQALFFFYFNFLDIDLMQLDIVKRQNISKKQLQN